MVFNFEGWLNNKFLIAPSDSDDDMCSVMSEDDDSGAAQFGQSTKSSAPLASCLDGTQSHPSAPVASNTIVLTFDNVNVNVMFLL